MMADSAFDSLADDGGRGIPNDPQQFADVFRSLRRELDHDDVAFVKTCQLDIKMPNDTAGRIIRELQDWGDCPIDIDVWGGKKSPPRTYRLTWSDGGDAR